MTVTRAQAVTLVEGVRKGSLPAPWAALGVVLAGTWAYLSLRVLPSLIGDVGSYLSVAARLRAGDALYRDVWENKEPFFYYGITLATLVTPSGPVFLELGYLIVCGIAGWSIAQAVGASMWTSVFAGFVSTPLILTGSSYYPLMSHLPGEVLILVAVALALRGKSVWVGIAVGLMLFVKLPLLPVALVMAVAAGGWRAVTLTRSCVGGLIAVAAGSVVLAVRGELLGFVETLLMNVEYSSTPLLASGPPVIGRFMTLGTPGLALMPPVLLAALLLARRSHPAVLVRTAVVGFATGLLVLALTAYWSHHAQAILPALVIATIALVASARSIFDWCSVGLVVLLAFVWGGVAVGRYLDEVPDRWGGMRASHSSEALALLETHPTPLSYARFGYGDVVGHARGLGEWRLACSNFAEYPFTPEPILEAALACGHTADVVLLADDFQPIEGQARWNEFVARVRIEVAKNRTCRVLPVVTICSK